MKSTLTSLEPKDNSPVFHLDWELTFKCNLDCSYCNSHDNNTKHPPLADCLKTIDFFLEYADLYMSKKPANQQHALLNILGGEPLSHPDIVEIIQQARQRHRAKYTWPLAIHITTNLVISTRRWKNILDAVDRFTISYHTESSAKQQQQVKDNLLILRDSGKAYHCAVLMNPSHFDNNLEMIEFCKTNNINYLPRQLDPVAGYTPKYTEQQVIWVDTLYNRKKPAKVSLVKKLTHLITSTTNLSKEGRACCAGTAMCSNQDCSSNLFFVPNNNFKGWSCSVNYFFLFIKQVDRNIYLNKDCEMNYDSEIGPIGTLEDTDKIISRLRSDIQKDTLPVITCKRSQCLCGLCAPKAKTLEVFTSMMDRYRD